MDLMARNKIWELVDLPPQIKSIGNKWAFKIEHQANGSIDKYKFRLVAKGFTQIEGIDYEETFSPVVRFASIRLLIAMVAHFDLKLFQMDIKMTFLDLGNRSCRVGFVFVSSLNDFSRPEPNPFIKRVEKP